MTKRLLDDQRDHLRTRISELGLAEFEDAIIAEAVTVYRLRGSEQIEASEMGTTRFGGHPDVPKTIDVSLLEDLEFLYQVNLADLERAEELGLPGRGLLSVFSDGDDSGETFLFDAPELVRHRMPDPDPEYIFSSMLPWNLTSAIGVDLPYLYEIEEADLEDEYQRLVDELFGPEELPFGEILGRFSTLNGDMREEAADECDGEPEEWITLWKVLSSLDSGLVISDHHELHGMIRKNDLQAVKFDEMYTVTTNG